MKTGGVFGLFDSTAFDWSTAFPSLSPSTSTRPSGTPAPSTSPSLSPSCSGTQVILKLSTDKDGTETYWDIKDFQGKVLRSVAQGTYGDSKNYTETVCLSESEFFFTIYDRRVNGMCCDSGKGRYEL